MSLLLHISDLHFGEEDRAALEAVEAFAHAEKPDVIVASGDLTAVGRQREFEAAFSWLAQLGAPVVATPGNHDTPYYELLPRLIAPFAGYHRRNAGVATPTLRMGPFAIATINSARGVQFRKNWALGAVSTSQVDAVSTFLRESNQGEVRILATHHPLLWPDDALIQGDTRGGAEARKRLLDMGVQVFLSGHLHTPHVHLINGPAKAAAAITAPTLSIRQRGANAGFMTLRISDLEIKIHLMEIVEGAVKPSPHAYILPR
jgi:3',5'-cyclic AMP phosphodiesterase CpdA